MKIRCRCDVCGEEKLMIKQKLAQRGDNYERCRSCYYVRNGSSSRAMVDALCVDCGRKSKRRADALKAWSGRCRPCASKETASRPEVKEVLRENGRRATENLLRVRGNVKNYRRGADNNLWRGGLTDASRAARNSPNAKMWRQNVFARDNYTCSCCGLRGGDLEADHIMPFALYPELRYSTFNGRTVCKPCHKKYGAKVTGGRQTSEPKFPEYPAWRIG